MVFGQFTINSLSFFRDAANNLRIDGLGVNFVQPSEGPSAPALSGHFIYQVSAVPEPSSIVAPWLGWRARLHRELLRAIAAAPRPGRPGA
jgi:hypothetical protein